MLMKYVKYVSQYMDIIQLLIMLQSVQSLIKLNLQISLPILYNYLKDIGDPICIQII